MFFKKIEMLGFKSFASKTEVQFLPGITVVVGPNGCGKSNIFDAIRWSLGEQSPKSLRGQKMGDVIFNGSATQKPHSFSQVTLIINNEDKRIPIDFNEITIMRRLYRTGESEYFINKTPCRLRDIHDLFMDTGVGTDSYSVMQQQQVDQIINDKPRERRYIFEEAAGISKYKARKEEALRKLLRTEEDLLRLSDLIAEVTKNVNSLKRAAARAERYKALYAEQLSIQMRYLYLQHKAIDEQFTIVSKESLQIKDKLNEATAKIAVLEAQNEETQLKSEDLNRQISEKQQAEYQLATEIERREHLINLQNERSKNLDEKKSKLLEEIAKQKELLKAAEIKKALIAKDLAELEEQISRALELLNSNQEQYSRLKSEHEQKLMRLDEKKAELNRRISTKIKIENDKRFAETMIEKLSAEINEAAEVIDNINKEIERVSGLREQAHKKTAALSEQLKEKNNSFDANKNKIAALEKEELNCRKSIEALSQEIRKAQTRLATLEELQLSYEGYYNGVKEVMRASDSKRLGGVVGIVAKLINLKKEHEAAIEAALGGDIQDIVTITVEDAKAAIEYLRKTNFGRATFIPLDFIEPPNLNNSNMKKILSTKGVVGLARELVQYDKSLQKAIEYLFGDTIIVEHIDVAIKLGKDGFRVRSVSLDGDLLNPRGVLTGGSHKSRGLLSRERELNAAKKEMVEIQKKDNLLREGWEKVKSEIRALYKTNEELLRSIHNEEVQFATDKRTYESLNEQFYTLKRQLEQLAPQRDNKLREVKKYEETVLNSAKQMQAFEDEGIGLDEELKTIEAQVGTDWQIVQKAQEGYNNAKIEISSLRERKTAYDEKRRAVASEISQLEQEEKRKSAESADIDTDKERIIKEIAEIKKELADLIQKRDAVRLEMSSHTQEQQSVSTKLREVGEALQILFREQNELTNKLHEFDVAMAHIETQKENFTNQAAEKFNLPLAEVLIRAEENLKSEMENTADVEERNKLTNREFLQNRLYEIRDHIERLGVVNPGAIDEYNEQKERLDFNLAQQKDLSEAKESLRKTIAQIDETTSRMFTETFENIRKNFVDMFRKLFNGGKADLVLVEEENQPEPGVDIIAQPPGKKLQNISLLSGGEKALTAIALLFGIFLHKPSPFCILDEIDAPLDDANVQRYTDILKEFSLSTQFIVITHNKQTMALADTIYGITMEEPGVSKLVSVKFEDIENADMVVGK